MAHEKILIIDDEEAVRRLIKRSLMQENYSFQEADSGQAALEILQSEVFDLIILDVMLGDEDGFELIKEIKAMGIHGPILFVSGRGEDYDQILGLGLGAANYITKPFSPAVLCAHVKAQLRACKELSKAQGALSKHLIQGAFKFDLKSYKLYKNESFVDLSYKENLLMKFFMEHPHQVFTKQQLYENIWSETVIDDNAIMVYIHNLRKKVEDDPKAPQHIATVWGIGYKFVP